MDIHACEVHISKASDVLAEMAQSNTQYYAKTRQKLMSIGRTLMKDMELILSMLEEDIISTEPENEFSDNPVPSESKGLLELQQSIYAMNNKLDEFVNLVQSPKQRSSSMSGMPIVNAALKSNSAEDISGITETDISDKTSAESRRYIMMTYGNALNSIPDSDDTAPEVRRCAKILQTWWNTRFVKHRTGFFYNVNSIPQWITEIVISYAYNLEQDTLSQYLATWNEWATEVSSGKPNKYALPFSIHNVGSNRDNHSITQQAIELWDGLLSLMPTLRKDARLNQLGVGLSRFVISDLYENQFNQEFKVV